MSGVCRVLGPGLAFSILRCIFNPRNSLQIGPPWLEGMYLNQRVAFLALPPLSISAGTLGTQEEGRPCPNLGSRACFVGSSYRVRHCFEVTTSVACDWARLGDGISPLAFSRRAEATPR